MTTQLQPLLIRLGFAGALALALLAPVANAQNIYKCTHSGQITYTDKPCPGGRGELLHQADASDVIDQYLRLGQYTQAERYAQSHQLKALYAQRLAIHEQQLEDRERVRADADAAAQQRDAQARADALAADAANNERLRGENDALRQQNAQFQDQLSQPVYAPSPAYLYPSRYPHRQPHDGRPDDPSPSWPPRDTKPIFHPCEQLAGGRVKC